MLVDRTQFLAAVGLSVPAGCRLGATPALGPSLQTSPPSAADSFTASRRLSLLGARLESCVARPNCEGDSPVTFMSATDTWLASADAVSRRGAGRFLREGLRAVKDQEEKETGKRPHCDFAGEET